MKRTFIIAMTMMTMLFSFGQSIVTTNKQWNNRVHYCYSLSVGTEHIKFTSDTVINSLTYKKVVRALDEYEQMWEPYGYIRENQEKKIYYKINPGDTEQMLYDFNSPVHDTIYASGLITYFNIKAMVSMPYYVHHCDSILIDQTYRKRINLALLDDTSNVYTQWIDSIGSTGGMLHNEFLLIGADYYFLLCYFENGILKYKNPEYSFCHYWPTGIDENTESAPTITIFPNPVTGISVMEIRGIENYSQVTVKFYDLFGSEVMSEKAEKNIIIHKGKMPPGLYFYCVSVDDILIRTGKLIVQ